MASSSAEEWMIGSSEQSALGKLKSERQGEEQRQAVCEQNREQRT
jgi:hypothetical protein